jgi:hypothetical protein
MIYERVAEYSVGTTVFLQLEDEVQYPIHYIILWKWETSVTDRIISDLDILIWTFKLFSVKNEKKKIISFENRLILQFKNICFFWENEI